jgi:hypothetical protein
VSCNANVDPLDWIFKMSIEKDMLMSRINILKKQITALELQRKKLLLNGK